MAWCLLPANLFLNFLHYSYSSSYKTINFLVYRCRRSQTGNGCCKQSSVRTRFLCFVLCSFCIDSDVLASQALEGPTFWGNFWKQVPLGTMVRDENQKPVADLEEAGARFLAARGGAGGRGNHHFLTNENRHPRLHQLGAQGESLVYNLEMKCMAHAGLVSRNTVFSNELTRTRSSVLYCSLQSCLPFLKGIDS